MNRFLAISLIVLVAGTTINSLEFEDLRPWEHPKSANRRTAERVDDSSEEHVTDGPSSLDVDSISGPIGGNSGGEIEVNTHQKPSTIGGSGGLGNDSGDFDSFMPTHSLNPFFTNPFFNFFGNPTGVFSDFGFGEPHNIPWWKGPNICTERKEELSDWNSNASNDSSEEVAGAGVGGQSLRQRQNVHYGIHISLNTCVEKTNKRVCTQVVSEGDKKKTISTTQQCCRGYGRRRNSRSANIRMPCEELNLRSIIETSEKLGGLEFTRSAQKNDVDGSLRKNVTVFLPKDSTFTEFAEQMLESNLVVLPGSRNRRAADIAGITTKDLILNHIVPDVINIEDIENEQMLPTEYKNSSIRMNIFPRPPGRNRETDDEDEYGFRYTANCAPITKVNQEAENGIIHVVDRVLTPVTKSIMESLRERNDMAVLQTVLEKTDLAKTLADADKQFTLFAPNDQAFEKLDPQLRRTIKDGNGCALNILKNHILEMTFCSVAVVEDAKTSAINVLGEKMNLERVAPAPKEMPAGTQSEAEDLAGVKLIEINHKARVIESDIMATNGVIHVVDAVMSTESAMPPTSLMASRELSSFKQLVELSGFDLDSLKNVTIFTPTNAALNDNYWINKSKTDADSLKNNEELIKFIKYHVAKPLIKTCDLTEQPLDTESGDKVRINLYSTHTVFSNVFNRATVNCARLVHFDDDSCGSVLHQIDRPLEAPTQTLMGALEANEQYSMFVDLIKEANLTDMLSNENSSLTLLVPKNDIFTELQDTFDELRKEPNRARLERLIKSHIIDDVLCCAGIVPSEWPFVRLVKTINDVDLRLGRDRRPKIQNAGVTKCDIIATNGIIHEINDVISTKHPRRTAAGSHISSDSSEEDTAPVLRTEHHFPFMSDFLFP